MKTRKLLKCRQSSLAAKKRMMLRAAEEHQRMREADEAAEFLVCDKKTRKLVRSVRLWMSFGGDDEEYSLLLKHGKVFGSKMLGKLLKKAIACNVVDELFCGNSNGSEEDVVKRPVAWNTFMGAAQWTLKRKALMLACLLAARMVENEEKRIWMGYFEALQWLASAAEGVENLMRKRLFFKKGYFPHSRVQL
jgi:hypothetical protein